MVRKCAQSWTHDTLRYSDFACISGTVLYSASYDELQAISIQNAILLWLLYTYQNRSTGRKMTMLIGLVTWVAAAYGNYLTPGHLTALFDVNSVILLISRVPQILQNYRSKNTGQLSVITYGLQFAGTLARIFTTLQEENAGAAMMRGVVMCTLTQRLLLLSLLF